MGYFIEVQKNPHDLDRPSYSEGDASNVVNLQIDDDGVEAEVLHRLIGLVVARGKSLDADAVDDYRETTKRLRDRLSDLEPDEDRRADTPDMASSE